MARRIGMPAEVKNVKVEKPETKKEVQKKPKAE